MNLRSPLSVIVVALVAMGTVSAFRSALQGTHTAGYAKASFGESVLHPFSRFSVAADANSADARPANAPEQAALDLAALIEEQRQVVAGLQETSERLITAYERVAADFEYFQPRQEWHERMIRTNETAYLEIFRTITSLTENEFPTRRTWYGDTWKELTMPFRVGRFPVPQERDRLLRLLDEITEVERRRTVAVSRVAGDVPSSQQVAGNGFLGPRWEQLTENLKMLKYN